MPVPYNGWLRANEIWTGDKGQLYQHTFSFHKIDAGGSYPDRYFTLDIITNVKDELGAVGLTNWLKENGFTQQSVAYPINGFYFAIGYGVLIPYSVFINTDNSVHINCVRTEPGDNYNQYIYTSFNNMQLKETITPLYTRVQPT